MTKLHYAFIGLILCGSLAPSPAATLSIFKPSDKPIACPGSAHPKYGCLIVTGKSVNSGAAWSAFKRIAFLGGSSAAVPARCIAVATTGALISAKGTLHFRGDGDYCPKTDRAVYHYVVDPRDAKTFGVPLVGTITYDGRKDIETYSS